MDAEHLSSETQHLLSCEEDGTTRVGEERTFISTTSQSFERHVNKVIKGDFDHCFAVGQIYIDASLEKKPDTAPPTLLNSTKEYPEKYDKVLGLHDHFS